MENVRSKWVLLAYTSSCLQRDDVQSKGHNSLVTQNVFSSSNTNMDLSPTTTLLPLGRVGASPLSSQAVRGATEPSLFINDSAFSAATSSSQSFLSRVCYVVGLISVRLSPSITVSCRAHGNSFHREETMSTAVSTADRAQNATAFKLQSTVANQYSADPSIIMNAKCGTKIARLHLWLFQTAGTEYIFPVWDL